MYLYSRGNPENLLNCEVRIRERRGMNFLVKVKRNHWCLEVFKYGFERVDKFYNVKKFRIIRLRKSGEMSSRII